MVCQRCRGLLVREIFDDLARKRASRSWPHDVLIVDISRTLCFVPIASIALQ